MVKLFCRYRFVCAPPPPPAPLPPPRTFPTTHTVTPEHIHILRRRSQETNTGTRLPSATSRDPTERILTPELEPLPSVRTEQSDPYTYTRALALCLRLPLSSETAIHCGREAVMSITERSSATFSPSGITNAEILSTARDSQGCQITSTVLLIYTLISD